MAQGKLKVKAKNSQHKTAKSSISKNKTKQVGLTKKGHKTFAPKKATVLELHKVKKSIQKGIHKNIEEELSKKAHQLEEGKPFKVLANPVGDKSQGGKKKGKK